MNIIEEIYKQKQVWYEKFGEQPNRIFMSSEDTQRLRIEMRNSDMPMLACDSSTPDSILGMQIVEK